MPYNTNEQVVDAFLRNKPCKNVNMSTDGLRLYSYSLKIADTDVAGEKLVINYRAGGSEYHSHTTSTHVGYAERAGCRLVESDYLVLTAFDDLNNRMRMRKISE